MQQTYFLMKNRIVLFIAGCCALLLSSCLGSDDTQYELSKDCQILSFSLSNDSIPGLKMSFSRLIRWKGKYLISIQCLMGQSWMKK